MPVLCALPIIWGIGAWLGYTIFKGKNRSKGLGIAVGLVASILLGPIGWIILSILVFTLPKVESQHHEGYQAQSPRGLTQAGYANFAPQQQMPPVIPAQPFQQNFNPPSTAPFASAQQPNLPTQAEGTEKAKRLQETKMLLDEGLISQAEYDNMRTQILNN